jgi:hypothetical protein
MMISPSPLTQVVIRYSGQDDEPALARLAGRDSKPLPEGKLLVAEAGGEIRAALPLDGPEAVADPFSRTDELMRLLKLRRSQVRTPRLRPAFVGRLTRR